MIDPVLLQPYLIHALAGGAGGGIRWWSTASSWRKGLGHVFAGAMAGTFFGGAMFAFIRPAADFSGLSTGDGELMGAHLAGVLAVNLYTTFPELATAIVRAWLASRASTTEGPK